MGRLNLESFIRLGLGPLFPASWRRVRRRWMRSEDIPHWIQVEFARRAELGERPLLAPTPLFPTYAQRGMYEGLGENPMDIRLLEIAERSNAEFGLELRMPYLDRRIMEFGIAIPEDQRWRGSVHRLIQRRAMKSLMQPRVASPEGSITFALFLTEVLGESFFPLWNWPRWVGFHNPVFSKCIVKPPPYAAGRFRLNRILFGRCG